MSAPRKLRWIRTPRQPRSRATLQRLLDAAEQLLEKKTFEEVSVTEVAAKARSSVGAFYARFSDKDALLDALYERHQQEAMANIAELSDPRRWEGVPLPTLIRKIVRFVIDLYREHCGLMRTLVLRGYTKPDARYGRSEYRGKLAIVRMGELIGARSREIGHPDPRFAASLGFLMVLATLREKILFGKSTASALRTSDRRLEDELVRAYLAYLQVPQTTRSGKR